MDETIKASLETYTTISWIILSLFIFTVLLILIIAYFYHKKLNGSDNPNWISLILYFISTIDFITDIIFFGELSIQNHTLTLYAALFLFIPHILSNIFCIISILRWRHCGKYKPQHIEWIYKYDKFLVLITFFGNFYGSIELLNSMIFHLDIFNMQILIKDRNPVHIFHIINDVLIGSFPSMIVQMAYMSLNQYNEISIAIIAMIFSFISIAIGIFIIVSKLCNSLVEILIPSDNDSSYNNNNNNNNIYRLMICKSDELNINKNKHYLYAHIAISTAWSTVLQISEYQIETVFITNLSSNNDGIKCKLQIKPEINDENLYLFLNLLESPSSGLYDLLKQEIVNKLCLNDISNLQIIIQRTNAISLQPIDDNNKLNIDYNDIIPTDHDEEIMNITWQCPSCTFSNHYLIEQCEVCQTEKPVDWNKIIIQNTQNTQNQQNQLLIDDINNNDNNGDNNNDDDDDDNDIMKNINFEESISIQDDQKQLFKDIEKDNKEIKQEKDGGVWTGDLIDDEEEDEIDNIPNIDIGQELEISEISEIDENQQEEEQQEEEQQDEEESDMKQDEMDLFDNRFTNDGLNDDFDDLPEPDVFG